MIGIGASSSSIKDLGITGIITYGQVKGRISACSDKLSSNYTEAVSNPVLLDVNTTDFSNSTAQTSQNRS